MTPDWPPAVTQSPNDDAIATALVLGRSFSWQASADQFLAALELETPLSASRLALAAAA